MARDAMSDCDQVLTLLDTSVRSAFDSPALHRDPDVCQGHVRLVTTDIVEQKALKGSRHSSQKLQPLWNVSAARNIRFHPAFASEPKSQRNGPHHPLKYLFGFCCLQFTLE